MQDTLTNCNEISDSATLEQCKEMCYLNDQCVGLQYDNSCVLCSDISAPKSNVNPKNNYKKINFTTFSENSNMIYDTTSFGPTASTTTDCEGLFFC